MNKIEFYNRELSGFENVIPFLLANSNLPGPRANLELLFAFLECSTEKQVMDCLSFTPLKASTNTPGEFVAACGAAGLGNLITNGKSTYLDRLKALASDPRWRVREGVAFALQHIGKKDFNLLKTVIYPWVQGNNYEKRAVVAGICEPVLLKDHVEIDEVLRLLEKIIVSIAQPDTINDDSLHVLKKGLGYGLSVAMVADPVRGKFYFENLIPIALKDKNIHWVLKENLKKNRLLKMDKNWVEEKIALL